jgi:hypothetical protein
MAGAVVNRAAIVVTGSIGAIAGARNAAIAVVPSAKHAARAEKAQRAAGEVARGW